ncbi:hypothetical protein [Nostoc sp.]
MKILDRRDAINHHKDAINRRLYNIDGDSLRLLRDRTVLRVPGVS